MIQSFKFVHDYFLGVSSNFQNFYGKIYVQQQGCSQIMYLKNKVNLQGVIFYTFQMKLKGNLFVRLILHSFILLKYVCY